MLDALRHTCAADAAIASALTFLEAGLWYELKSAPPGPAGAGPAGAGTAAR